MKQAEVRAFQAGDEALFRQLVSDHSKRLLAYMRAFAPDPSEAEDLVQETWLRAYRSRASFRGDGSLLGWLFAVSRSVGLDHRRRDVAESTKRTRAALDSSEQIAVEKDPIDCLDRADRVRAALTQLPPRQRDTVVLRILDDRTVKDTARALGCAEGTVKASLSQALQNLRNILNPNERPTHE